MKRNTTIFASVLCLWPVLPSAAQARNVEPNTMFLRAGVGPSFRMGSGLGGSTSYLDAQAELEFALNRWFGLTGQLDIGLASSWRYSATLGGRYRFADLELPVSPFLQFGALVGRMHHVLGASLTTLGARTGAGLEYFITSEYSMSAVSYLDILTTRGVRPTAFSVLSFLLTGGYAF